MTSLPLKVRQFNEDGCLSHLVACAATGEAIAIDPTFPVEKILQAIQQDGLRLRYVIDTHTHADHLTAAAPAPPTPPFTCAA